MNVNPMPRPGGINLALGLLSGVVEKPNEDSLPAICIK